MNNTDIRKNEIKKFWPHHFNQIKEEGWKALLRKLYVGVRYGITLPIFLLAAPIVIIVRFIRPIILIRFGSVRSDVIGNSAFNVEYYLSESELENRKTLDFFYFQTSIMPNEQWALMVRRHFRIHSFVKYLDRLNCFILGGEKNTVRMVSRRTGSRDIKGVLYRTKPHMPFSKEENKRGRDFLEGIGFRNVDRFVCILVRDSAYKDQVSWIKQDWRYHNYRDSDIDTYHDVVFTLAKKGYWVMRMGKVVHKAFSVNHPRVLDYSNSNYRNDFLDIWLMANCYFCITNGTGLDDICVAFRRPLVEVNYLPVGLTRCNQALTVDLFKKLKWKSNGNYLSLTEQIETGAIMFLHTQLYDDLGLEIIDNSSEEIMDAVIEMEGRLNGTWVETAEDFELQTVFWKKFKTSPHFPKRFGWIHPESRISSSFLRKNHDWFLK